MKKRVVLLGACLVFSIASFFYSSSSYVTYFSFITDIRKNTLAIEKLSQTNNDLQKEFEEVRGEDVPKNLKEVLDFLEKYENVQINEVHSFNMKGGGIEVLDTITDTSTDVICDGFEIVLTVDDLNTFISFLDRGELLYHSVDFLFSSNKAILRVRTGGDMSEQINN